MISSRCWLILTTTLALSLFNLAMAPHAMAQRQVIPTEGLISVDPDDPIGFPLAWRMTVPEPLADLQTASVYNLFLVTAAQRDAETLFHRLSLARNPIENTPERIEVTGLPTGFRLEAMEVNPLTQHLLVAGSSGGRPAILRSRISPRAELDPFEALPVPPEVPVGVRFDEILVSGVYGLFLYEEPANPRPSAVGVAVNLGLPVDRLQWIPVPAPAQIRTGATIFPAHERLVMVGGTWPPRNNEGEPVPATMCEVLPFEPPNFTAWSQVSLPSSRRLVDTIGANHGMVMFTGNRVPLGTAAEDDTPTSQTVFMSLDRVEQGFSLWREVLLAQPEAPIRAMTIDPGHGYLLAMAETGPDGALEAWAYQVPTAYTARPRSEEEIILGLMEAQAANPNRISADEVLATARENSQYALVVVTSGGREEDIRTRVDMASSRYYYMTQNTQSTYLTGGEGRSLLSRYGLLETPAYLLLDPDGNLVRSHQGSIPSPEELFQLTSPTRYALPGDDQEELPAEP